MISGLDKGISLCKKYNEAKINRKYEIIISDLQTEIKRLQDNLTLEQDARSPTKKHISDILEKLVFFKNENERLNRENGALQERIRGL
jgi:FtsZ-binding cell division protein ZapB